MFETPINFLDRFIMLFNSPDYHLKDIKYMTSIQKCADFLCVQMLKSNKFLDYRPSQLAATALLAAINVAQYADTPESLTNIEKCLKCLRKVNFMA